MGRPLNGTLRAEELNVSLRALGQDVIPRDKWDRIVCRFYGIGIEMAQNLTRTGEVLGFWVREGGRAGGAKGGRKTGAIRLLPQAQPLPVQQPVAVPA